MKTSKNRITFKVLIGYIILGVLATISSILVLSEMKTFTRLQMQDISDRNKIVKVGGLIADIYENESLARAAIQLNSSKKFNEYVNENEKLLLKIDSLNYMVKNRSQEFILDSIKLVINKKLNNITDLKNFKLHDNSDASINNAIKKLSAIDPLLGKISIHDFVEYPEFLDKKTRKNLEEYVSILNKYNPKDSINSIDQKQIDSLLSISRDMLKEVQKETTNQRISLQKKERELIENDLTISRKLRELLNMLERDIINYTDSINSQRQQTLNQSKNIIFIAAGISFIIIIIFSIIFLNDFWKTQRYRKQLERANATASSLLKSREHLISMVSHDLRTPLNTITGYSELLKKHLHTNKEANYIDHIHNASTYMAQLVDDLLDFSKLENSHIAIERIPFNLEKHVEDIVQTVKNAVQEKPISFILKHAPSINQPIVSDPVRIKQILYNLIINAHKFTNQGSITIKTDIKQEVGKNILEIMVKDTGIGIGKAQQKYIFKAFAQGSSGEENQQKGFGLGLTISSKLAALLGGTITLESELNQGSTFILRIPITFSETHLNSSKTKETNTVFNLKAIVVEDDAAMGQLLKEVLNQFGMHVHVFENGKSALEHIADITFDVVLTDIQLPKMNGIHFMELLKKNASYNNQPIIAMTGRSNLPVADYLKSGFSGVLIKPFHHHQLEQLLRGFFRTEPLKTNLENLGKPLKNPSGFSVKTLALFLNNDTNAIKKTLHIFLEETQNNLSLLQLAKKDGDVSKLNALSHKMLSMFKQLEVVAIIPLLETFEDCKVIDDEQFDTFEKELHQFINSLKNYLN